MQTTPQVQSDEIETLIMQVSAGDRGALRALFEVAGPAMAARLGFEGVAPQDAEQALIETFADLWKGDYAAPLRPGQSLSDWLGDLAAGHAGERSASPVGPITMSDDLWGKVARRAFPENWRNILARTDLLFGVVSAVVWALIYWAVTAF